MIKQLIKSSLSYFGFEIHKKIQIQSDLKHKILETDNPFIGYDYAKEGYEAVQLTKEYSMMPHINLFTLYEQAAYCEKNNIEGAFVECGVWKGGAVGIMAKANLDFGKTRREVHLFDAFDDICAPDIKVDGKKAAEDLKFYAGISEESLKITKLEPVKGFYDKLGGHGTIDSCKRLLEEEIKYPTNNLYYHKGWFQDTLPLVEHQIDKIAILRLDGDWYDSIKICLDYLFSKVVSGGVIVVDDYGYYEGCTKAVDEFLQKNDIITFLSYSSVGCRYFIKK